MISKKITFSVAGRPRLRQSTATSTTASRPTNVPTEKRTTEHRSRFRPRMTTTAQCRRQSTYVPWTVSYRQRSTGMLPRLQRQLHQKSPYKQRIVYPHRMKAAKCCKHQRMVTRLSLRSRRSVYGNDVLVSLCKGHRRSTNISPTESTFR